MLDFGRWIGRFVPLVHLWEVTALEKRTSLKSFALWFKLDWWTFEIERFRKWLWNRCLLNQGWHWYVIFCRSDHWALLRWLAWSCYFRGPHSRKWSAATGWALSRFYLSRANFWAEKASIGSNNSLWFSSRNLVLFVTFDITATIFGRNSNFAIICLVILAVSQVWYCS